jgi:hypothetical protein
MTEKEQTDGIVVHSNAGRRKFIRRGAAFVAAAGVAAASSSRTVLAADCDRGGTGAAKPEHGGNGSDSDKGAGADPAGCGKQYEDYPKISLRSPLTTTPDVIKKARVAKVIG